MSQLSTLKCKPEHSRELRIVAFILNGRAEGCRIFEVVLWYCPAQLGTRHARWPSSRQGAERKKGYKRGPSGRGTSGQDGPCSALEARHGRASRARGLAAGKREAQRQGLSPQAAQLLREVGDAARERHHLAVSPSQGASQFRPARALRSRRTSPACPTAGWNVCQRRALRRPSSSVQALSWAERRPTSACRAVSFRFQSSFLTASRACTAAGAPDHCKAADLAAAAATAHARPPLLRPPAVLLQ